MTSKETKLIQDIGRQIGAECVRLGISNPTQEQINSMFVARCQRNIELCEGFLNRKPWAAAMRQALSIEIWHDGRKAAEMERLCAEVQ